MPPSGSRGAPDGAEVEEKGPVSLEDEMMKLAKKHVEYQYMVTILNPQVCQPQTCHYGRSELIMDFETSMKISASGLSAQRTWMM